MLKDKNEYEEIIELKVDSEKGRIDKFLAGKLEKLSRSKIQGLIEKDCILVNKKKIKSNYKIQKQDHIIVYIPKAKEINLNPENLPLNIIYQDADIAIINKAQGMVVHPAAGHKDGTLVNALLYHLDDLSGINGEIRPGIVHRLDKDTSGILMIAKNDEAHVHLSRQLAERKVERKYWALVHGIMPHKQGTIDAPIGRDPKNRKRNAVVNGGKEAVSHFKLLKTFKKYSLIEVQLESGRTHQIRVHLNYIDYPVAGDELYGLRKTLKGEGQFLHARSVKFTHPRTGEEMSFKAELPSIFKEQIAILETEEKNQ